MSTTTLRLPDELKTRLSRLAESAGTSAHALMLEILAEAAQQREARAAFEAEAEQRLRRMARTGEYFDVEDVRPYILARARGEHPPRPKPRRMNSEEQAVFKASLKRRAP